MQLDRPAWPNETSEWALNVVGGPWAETRLACDQAEIVLGRHGVGAALFRGDRAVSRRHAVVRMVGGTCVVEDHYSTNGTFVNEVPIDRPTVLGPEDELRIGATRLRLTPALAGTALLDAIPAPDPDSTPANATQPANVLRAHKAGKLSLAILAAIAGTVLASALNGSAQLRLAAAALGSAVPAFMTEPGRHQRARVTAAVVLMATALFVTYGGATLFSYVTDHGAVYPVPSLIRPKAHKASPTPTGTSYSPTPLATPTLPPPVTPTPTPSPTPTPMPTPTPTPPQTPTPSFTPTGP